jgi:predicted glutamine amidotransferase
MMAISPHIMLQWSKMRMRQSATDEAHHGFGIAARQQTEATLFVDVVTVDHGEL